MILYLRNNIIQIMEEGGGGFFLQHTVNVPILFMIFGMT